MIRVLVVEKNKGICGQIDKALSELGYHVTFASSYEEGMDEMWKNHIDMVIADYLDGASKMCSDLRTVQNAVPFITIISDATKRRKRVIFRSNADGYLEIPFDSEELQMRVKNLFWRCHVEDSAIVQYGNCKLNTENYTLECGTKTIELRRMEFLLLEKLLSYPGRVFSRGQLLDELWGYDCESDPRTVDTHIKQLRKKLNKVKAIKIQTIRGIGYRAAVPK